MSSLSEKKGKSIEKKELVPVKPKPRSESAVVPYRAFELRDDFDRAFDRFRREFEGIFWPSERLLEREFPLVRRFEGEVPSVDIEDCGKELRFTADVPGFKKDEVEVHVEDDAVEISGKKSLSHEEKLKGYVRKERGSESFYRRIPLPAEVKTDNVQANLKDGVLELTLPKKTPTTRKRIVVK